MPTKRPKTAHTITLNLPRPLIQTLNEAAHVAGVTLSQVINVILAMRLVTLNRDPIPHVPERTMQAAMPKRRARR